MYASEFGILSFVIEVSHLQHKYNYEQFEEGITTLQIDKKLNVSADQLWELIKIVSSAQCDAHELNKYLND